MSLELYFALDVMAFIKNEYKERSFDYSLITLIKRGRKVLRKYIFKGLPLHSETHIHCVLVRHYLIEHGTNGRNT